MAKVLIADDEKDVVELLKFVLERDGHTVFEANDGQSAIAIAEQEEIDMALFDVMMPKMDGYSLAVHFREDNKLKDIPVVIITAKKQAEELFQPLSNVVACFEKPFIIDEIRARLRDLLKKRVQ